MVNDKRSTKNVQIIKKGSSSSPVYGLGLIGAMVFYIQQAEGFGAVITAILKALVWPAFVVYDLLKHLAG